MPQSLAAIDVHLIYSTKNRQPLIEEELRKYHASIMQSPESPMLRSDGAADHIPILFRLGRKASIAEVVEELKKSSSKWIKTKGPEYADFFWQERHVWD